MNPPTTFSAGDTAWVLISTALVMLMVPCTRMISGPTVSIAVSS